ncbi:hypothetical protein BCL69_102513 [Nitrosomonas communis]|uniref:Uncharacterized protein n=1 Tax=Nitrosomonas communis TaxID=44574 RepID=A0A5D3YEL7_9PROT|nr:hypothetical protein BCL69_102513 [Nitrosomonas communis]
MPCLLTPSRLVRSNTLVLIRVWIILDVLRQPLHVDLGGRLVTGCLGIGSLDPTRHTGHTYAKTLGHLRNWEVLLLRTDNILRRNDIG